MDPPTEAPSAIEGSLLKRLAAVLDYHAPSRSAWTLAWRGHERKQVQAFLLECARSALRESTTHDALSLYKAAHAVLPLRGAPLLQLALLLSESGPLPLEWCDVLVAALGEAETPDRQRILEALTVAAAQGGDSSRTAWIRRRLGRITE